MDFRGDGFLHNISSEGISFIVSQPLKFDFVELNLVHPPNKVFKLDGRIIHCTKLPSGVYLAGIRLLGSTDEVRGFNELIMDCNNEIQKSLKINMVGFLSQ